MATEKYLNPFTDFGFKKLFAGEPNKELLIDFLNQLLPPHHQIQDLTYVRNEQLGDTRLDRGAVFDIYCVSPSGEHFVVELQKAKQLYFKDRSVFICDLADPRAGPARRLGFQALGGLPADQVKKLEKKLEQEEKEKKRDQVSGASIKSKTTN